MKKKLYFLFVFLILLTSLVIWRKPLTLGATRVAFKYLSEKSLGEPIDFEQVSFEKGKVVLTAPRLGNEMRVLQKGGLYLEADTAEVCYDLNWLHKTLQLQVYLKKPSVKVVKTPQTALAIKKLFESNIESFDIKTYIRMDQGDLCLIDESELQHLQFNFEIKEVGPSQEIAHLTLVQGKSYLKGFYHHKQENYDLKLDLEDVELGQTISVSNYILELFEKKPLYLLEAEGIIHGSINVLIRPEYLPMTQTKLEVQQLQVKGGLFKTSIPKLSINAETSNRIRQQNSLSYKELFSELIQNGSGAINLPIGAKVCYLDGSSEKWEAHDLKGKVLFAHQIPSKFTLEGELKGEKCPTNFFLEGQGLFSIPRGDIKVVLSHTDQPKSHLRLSLDPVIQDQFKLYTEINNFSESEVTLFKKIFTPLYPKLNSLNFKKGIIEAQVRCLIKNAKVTTCTFDHFALKSLFLGPTLWFKEAHNLNASGSFSLNLEKTDPLKTSKGDIEFHASSMELSNRFIEEVEGRAQVEKGELHYSKIQGYSAGLEAFLEWKKTREKYPLYIQIKGLAQNFFPFFPKNLASHYESQLKDEELLLQIKGNYQDNRVDLTAKCVVDHGDQIDIGCSLIRKQQACKNSRYLNTFIKSFIYPIEIAPTLTCLRRPSGFSSSSPFMLEKGWFSANQLPVKKYLCSLLFGKTTIDFTGHADVKGTFNPDTIALEYSNYHFKIDHSDLNLQVDGQKLGKGKHYYDIVNGTHFGSVFIPTGSCHLKSCGLNFDTLEGSVYITPDCIYAPSFRTHANQLDLNGNLKINFLGDGKLSLSVDQPNLHGKLSDFKNFFKAFGGSMLDTLPLEGRIQVHSQDSRFLLTRNKCYQHELKIRGSLTEGKTLLSSSLPLTDLSSSFFLNSKENFFEIENLEGKWRFDTQNFYQFKSHYLKLNLATQEPCLFDVRINDLYQDRVRLKGKFYLNPEKEDFSLKIILNSKKNHIGNIGLNHANLSLKNGLEYLHLDFESSLDSFNQDVNLLNQLLPHPSLNTLKSLKNIPLQGKITGQWIFNRADEKHQFYAWGDQVKVAKGPSSPLQLKGHTQKGFIYLDEFLYQKFKASFKLEEKPLSYFIHDFRLQGGQSLYLDMSGTYCKIFNSFGAKIHKLYCHLDDLKKHFPLLTKVSGQLDFKGEFEGGLFKKGWAYEADLMGHTTDLKIPDLAFLDDSLHFKIKGDKNRLRVCYLEGELKEAFNLSFPLKFKGYNLDLQKDLKLCSVDKIDFRLPASALQNVKSLMKEKMALELSDDFLKIKNQGCIEGALAYHPKNSAYAMDLSLKNDLYTYKNKQYALEDLHIRYGSSGFCVGAKIQYNHVPYWLDLKRDHCMKELIRCTLYEKNPLIALPESNPHLTLKCLNQENQPLLLQSVHGSLSGVKVDWVHKPEKDTDYRQIFMGQIQINGDQFLNKIPSCCMQVLKRLGIGEGYFLSGQLSLDPRKLQNFSFEGLLGGQDFDLLGYEFKSLSSSVFFSPQKILIKDLKVSDLSGEFHIPELDVQQDEGKYMINLPKMHLKNFKPSLLHKREEGPNKHKPLIVELLELNNLKGNLLEPSTLKGNGSLKFLKSPKKQSSLLDIPVHLISKLGLDLTMLNPVEGKILYEVKDQKIQLTRFVDVYSHDRNCYFQIAKTPLGSCIDFEGNLNIKIKMKQYVLLKITEPFIISIQGDFLNPKYSFRRKKLIVDVPQKFPK